MNPLEIYLKPEDHESLKTFVKSGEIDTFYNVEEGTGFSPEGLKRNLIGFIRNVLKGDITSTKQLTVVTSCHPINLVNSPNISRDIRDPMRPLVVN